VKGRSSGDLSSGSMDLWSGSLERHCDDDDFDGGLTEGIWCFAVNNASRIATIVLTASRAV